MPPKRKAPARQSSKSRRSRSAPGSLFAALLGDLDEPNRALSLGLTLSLILHAVLLSVHFSMPDMFRNRQKDSQLEIVLVNAKSPRKPAEPQARAQANLDGGGNTDENRRARTPLPPTDPSQHGTDIVEMQRRLREAEAKQQALLTKVRSEIAVQRDEQKVVQPEPPSPRSGQDLSQSALAMVRMEAEIARNIDEYNKRPRKKFVGARTVEAVEAQYVEDWRQKVERVGNLNYPDAAKGRMYGSLVLSVGIFPDGSVENIEINRSSGQKVLDEAARRIVQLAAPYGSFTPELRRNVDVLVITRTWTFASGDRLRSE